MASFLTMGITSLTAYNFHGVDQYVRYNRVSRLLLTLTEANLSSLISKDLSCSSALSANNLSVSPTCSAPHSQQPHL